MKKSRVLHFTEAPLGGVLSYIREITSYQIASDNVSHVYILAPIENIAVLNGLTHPKLTLIGFERPQRSFQGFFTLCNLVKNFILEHRPDVLHLHSSIAGLARINLLWSRRRLNVIYSPHGWSFSRLGERSNALMRWVERMLTQFTDHVVCVSNAEKAEAHRAHIDPDKCRVIENGLAPLPVDVVDRMIAERRNRTGPLNVLFVGRFDRQKGFDVFLEVMRDLGDAAQATAIGDYLLSSKPPPPCPANVTLLDWQPQSALAHHYAQADLLVMPSRWEGMPFVALEGMRAGLSVFATRAGGLNEVVVDASTGVCFEIDQSAAMARRIAQTSRSQLAAMGARGVERFRSFYTADRMNRRLLEFYAVPTRRPLFGRAGRSAVAALYLALTRPAEDNVSLQDRPQPTVGPLPWPE